METQYPEGYFIAIGVALGLVLGVPIALSLGNTGLIGLGLPLGVAIGVALEEKYRREGRLRPLTAAEKQRRRAARQYGIIALVLGVAALVSILFFLRD